MGKTYIVLLNWNGLDDTKECIRSLSAIKNQAFVIVVVDNNSSNNEAGQLISRFPEVRVIANQKNLGFCGGNNVGIKYCLNQNDCEYIMILNNDTVVTSNFLNFLINQLQKDNKYIVGPKILYYDKKDIVQTLGGRIILGGSIHIGKGQRSDSFKEPLRPDYLSGACFMAQKRTFIEVGLFDERFFAYAEDMDWCLRAKKLGYNFLTIPGSIIYHKHSQSTKGSYFKAYQLSKNNILFAKKNLTAPNKFFYISAGLFVNLLSNILNYKNLKFFRSYLRGVRDGIKLKVN